MTGRRWVPREYGVIALLLVAGLALRYWIAQFGYFGYDLEAFKEWMQALRQHPWNAFYAQSFHVPPDHLPGTLWVLAVVGEIHQALGIEGFFPLLKAVGVVADLAVGLFVYLNARALAGETVARWAAAAYLLNPGPALLSGLWGQWDSIALSLMLASLLSLIRRRPVLALVLMAMCMLFKPQFALVAFLMVIVIVANGLQVHGAIQSLGRRVWLAMRPVLWGGIASVLLVTAAGAPFGVWLLPGIGDWTYADRIRFAFDRYDGTTYGALGIWLLGSGSRTAPSDSVNLVAGLTPGLVSLGMTLVALVLAVCLLHRYRYTPTGLLVASITLLWAYLVFGTRMHERYLLPVIALLVVVSVVLPGVRWLTVAVSAAFAGNLYLALTYYHWTLPLTDWRSSPALMALSAVAVAAWVAFVAVVISAAPSRAGSAVRAPSKPEGAALTWQHSGD